MARRNGTDAALVMAAGVLLLGGCGQPRVASLQDAFAVIKTKEFVDLTHSFGPGIPHWSGFPDEQRETLYSY